MNLRDNLLPISPEILRQADHPAEIINYYFQHRKPFNEAKILIVGQGDVGKTSLVNQLMDNHFNPRETKTEGINIRRWGMTINGQDIRLNIWDFGGQEIMHATHQFFLTKRSLYILVLNARRDEQDNRLEYWLKLIESFGGGSPIIVVINKCDDEKLPDVDQRGLQTKYPSIRAFVETSCKTGQGIQQLRQIINKEAGELEYIHDELPVKWFAIKTQLEEMEADYIPYSQYEMMCQTEGITDESSQHTLIRFLHDLGVMLNFSDDLGLQDTNILNPEWVTAGVYRILNSNVLFQNKGVLDQRILEQILDTPTYPKSKHLFIVDMMRKFELCFEFEGFPSKQFLVPDLLPKEESYTGEWPATECLGFQNHYNVLPNSVMSRFIVRTHTQIYKNTYWRNGVVLLRGENTALVKADREDRKIFIYIAGKPQTRREFLAVIRAEFDYIHRTISKLEVKEKVPLPNHPDIVVDYQHLLNLESLGKTTFVPEGLKEEVSVKQLLNGIESDRSQQQRLPDESLVTTSSLMQPSSKSTGLPVNNPWASGSFYLIGFVVVLTALGVASIYIPWYTIVAVFLAALLAVSIIGALQLRNDDRFKEEHFLTLVIEFYKRLPLLNKSVSIGKLSDDERKT